MAEDIRKLSPEPVWRYFYDLTQYPRPTGHTEKLARHLLDLAHKFELQAKMDEVGNVLIKKPASPGYEDRKSVILQAHIDMVPQKNQGVAHDFEKDPIEAIVDGEWVRANQTTLGADNGIGVAMALAVLEDKDLEHGPLEVLLTNDEEVGMVGANGLEEGFAHGDILINLDSETEGELYIGCAGGIDVSAKLEYQPEEFPQEGLTYLKVVLNGLKGGHSGMDITLGRGNANKMLFRFLKEAMADFDISVIEVMGGSLRNAIPREAEVLLALPTEDVADFKSLVNDFDALYKKEYAGADKEVQLAVQEAPAGDYKAVPTDLMDNIVHAIEACQNGVITYLTDFPDTVESSSNMASVRLKDGLFEVYFLTRSSSESRKMMVASSIESVFALIGAEVEFSGSYNGWQPDKDSHVLKVMQEVYERDFGKVPEIKVIHAGLECGILQGALPDTEMISFGPTIQGPHSPDERVHIESVQKAWDFLVKSLQAL